MRRIIGTMLMCIGGILWEHGGFWNESERYEDLTLMGKLGYKMWTKGLDLMGVIIIDEDTIVLT